MLGLLFQASGFRFLRLFLFLLRWIRIKICLELGDVRWHFRCYCWRCGYDSYYFVQIGRPEDLDANNMTRVQAGRSIKSIITRSTMQARYPVEDMRACGRRCYVPQMVAHSFPILVLPFIYCFKQRVVTLSILYIVGHPTRWHVI